jgi:hypothetical protein
MKYKYHYKGEGRVHIAGVEGYCEPDTEVVSTQKINHPHFEFVEEVKDKVEKSEEKVETKKKKKE